MFFVAGKLSQKADPDGETFTQERALKINTYGVKMKEAGVSSEGQLELPITLRAKGEPAQELPTACSQLPTLPTAEVRGASALGGVGVVLG